MAAQGGRRAVPLSAAWTASALRSPFSARDPEKNGLLANAVERRELAVVNLLHAADVAQLNRSLTVAALI